MNETMINKLKCEYEYGTEDYFKVNLRNMVNSVFCYDNYGNDYDKYLSDKYIQNYYLDKSYCNGKGRLSKEVVESVVKEQVDYLCKHATIIHNVYTDGEGLSYNSIVFDDEVV